VPLLEIPVPNLLGGVSQQPAANRQPGQLESCDNAILHVVNGLAKRHGSRHLGKLLTGLESVRNVHWINRDPTERYAVLLGERRVRVFSALDGHEYPVKVNGTSTNAGRGKATGGTPLLYLDPRTPSGVVDQDEDFVIGAGDWLSTAANSVTSYVAGRGPFDFGRRESLVTVTADTVAEVGNGAVASVSDINQTFGTFSKLTALSVYAKKSSSAISDFELTLVTTAPDTYGARFAVGADGVITFAAFRVPDGGGGTVDTQVPGRLYDATVEDAGDGWYRCTVYFSDTFSGAVLPIVGTARVIQIRFHTTGATPANKRLLLFGCRCYDLQRALIPTVGGPIVRTETQPEYVYARPDLFRALTVADSTFILNTEVTAAMGAEVSDEQLPVGHVFVRQGGLLDVNYTVTVKQSTGGTDTFVFTTAAAGTTGLQTDDDIAEGLRALIDADANLQATRLGSVIAIVGTGGNNVLGVEVSDSRGDTGMVGFLNSIQKFTSLPLIAFQTVTATKTTLVKVEGDPERGADDYYVRFDAEVTPAGSQLAQGKWSEAAASAILTSLDEATMPLQLTRRQDNAAGAITGTPNAIYFDVSAVAWDTRDVGDDDSNPEPSFIGEKIQDLFLYRGRLGFLAADAVILSEAGEVFNFWRTTVLDVVDTDPIDITSGTRDVVAFKNAAASADRLILFSDRHQFELLGDPTLTPASAQLAPVRAFETLTQARPVDTGRGVLFARFDRSFSSLLDAQLLQGDIQFRVDELTVQAPRYIAGAIVELAHSSVVGLTAARVPDGNVLFMHQTFYDDQENRLQSAPHRWTFAPDTLIRGACFLDTELRLVVERDEGWFLESILVGTEVTDAGTPFVLLDRRADESQCTVTYDGGTDTTTITLPYTVDPDATMQVVDAESGLLVPVTGSSSTTLEVHGDLSDTDLYAGEAFTMVVGLTEPVIQSASPRGGTIALTGRPIDVHRLYLYVANTAFLELAVTPDLRTASSEEFAAAGLGTGLLLEGVLSTYTGDADFAILGQSTELTVEIKNDTPFPCFVQSGRWEVLNRMRTSLA